VSEYAGVVGRRVVQAEGGYSIGRSGETTSQSWGELMLRAGIGGHTEARVELNALDVSGGGTRARGLDDAAVSVKARLHSGAESARLDGVALIVRTSLPTGSRAVAAHTWAPSVLLSADWALTGQLALTTSAVYVDARENEVRVGRATAAAAVGYALTPRWQPQAEYSITGTTRGPAGVGHQVLGALVYLVGPDLQLDAWGARAFGEGGETRVGVGVVQRW
jgi:hypothetical protein